MFISSCLFNQNRQKSSNACLFHPACLVKSDKNPPMHIYYIRSFIRYLRVAVDKLAVTKLAVGKLAVEKLAV